MLIVRKYRLANLLTVSLVARNGGLCFIACHTLAFMQTGEFVRGSSGP